MLIRIDNLDEMMRKAGASNEALAESSGVNMHSIAVTRCRGRAMQEHNAKAVLQALDERKFAYKKRGPKGGRM